MEVTLLYFEDCPHWRTAYTRLHALAGELGFELRQRQVHEGDEEGFRGSPTILVDGHDPFAGDASTGMSCRRYDTPEGPRGVPSTAQLRAVLTRHRSVDPTVPELAAAVLRMDAPLEDAHRRLARVTFELLAGGDPVPVAELASRTGETADTVAHTLTAGNAVLTRADDGSDAVLAFGGLSVTETEHGLAIDGRQLYVWCAWDPLFLLPLLGRSGHVTSRCPVTERTINLLIREDGGLEADPPTTLLSFTAPSECCADVRSAFCALVHYFADEEAACAWTAERSGTFPLPLDDGVELARIVNERRFGVDEAQVRSSSRMTD